MSQNPVKCLCPCCNDRDNSDFLQSVSGNALFEELCRRGGPFERHYLFCCKCIDDAKLECVKRMSLRALEYSQPSPISSSYYSVEEPTSYQSCHSSQNVITVNPAYQSQEPEHEPEQGPEAEQGDIHPRLEIEPLLPHQVQQLRRHPIASRYSPAGSDSAQNPFIQEMADPMLNDPIVQADCAQVGLRLANQDGSPPPHHMHQPLSPVNYAAFNQPPAEGLFANQPDQIFDAGLQNPLEIETWEMEDDEQRQDENKDPTKM